MMKRLMYDCEVAAKVYFHILKEETMNTKNKYAPGILHSSGNGYYVTNEGTKSNPSFHVWIPDLTHSVCDSAYNDFSLAVCRCNYLAKNKVKAKYQYA